MSKRKRAAQNETNRLFTEAHTEAITLTRYRASSQQAAICRWARLPADALKHYQRAQSYLAEWEALFAPTDESELEYECLANCR